MGDLVPVLLAGGVGVRLWPASRESYPKQLLNVAGEGTLLQQAATRALGAAKADHIVTVTTETHYFQVADQLGDLDRGLVRHVIAEPTGRNTAAAVAVAAFYAAGAFDDPILWVAPADAYITEIGGLVAAVRRATAAAMDGRLVTFGMTPRDASPEFGYVRAGNALAGLEGVAAVAGFVEKPPRAEAERLIAAGGVYWNSGMFVFRAQRFLAELARVAPDVHAAARAAFDSATPGKTPLRMSREAYAAIPSLPVDKAVMERSDSLAVVPVDLGWSDVGNWQRLWEVSAKDSEANVAQGDVILERASGNLVRAEGRLVALAGVRDLVVVETADAVLVADRGDSDGIKAIVERLKAAGRPEATAHLTERRPWGTFAVLLEGARYKIKEITMKPGARLSLQMHHHRSEHWVVIEGTAKVTCGEEVRLMGENESTFIPLGAHHRLENPGKVTLRIIEVQSGSYVGEDDIVRLEDTYGRTA
ncbi:MAG: mannose-1-phosphate guanylyltransferase/mannose-6-phosphate isomerase [Alphaproteobacteria bacterium]|nr:mannose-1-phosphate guanylyltransferase/mannose-6-phosphate isomerase [Alphaproteobacteria bacterium]